MAERKESKSAAIHDQLDHPIIDVDGHNMDFMPVLEDYVREFAGKKGVEWYRRSSPWYDASTEQRRAARIARPVWWAYATKYSIDHVTGIVPALMEERLGEMGLDFSVIYPSPGRIGVPGMNNAELRQGLCRALNTYQADIFRPHAADLTPAAVIPMDTPAEAIEELDYAVNTLGLKVTQMSSFVLRPFEDDSQSDGESLWWDNLCIDSLYDYDPVWEKCLELRINPAFHNGTLGMGSRRSYSNMVYNHIGHFAAGQEPICKAMFLAGVTNRFPALRVAFLESGVAWAAVLFSELVEHFEVRNVATMRSDYDPSKFDYELARSLFDNYGSERFKATTERVHEIGDRLIWPGEADLSDSDLDEFAAAGIKTKVDIRDRFVPNFFFGCEGEDRMNALAFDRRILPFGSQLKAVFASDITHTTVSDMREVLEEAFELVEEGLLTPDDLRAMTFTNPIDLLAGSNPDFFAGTAVESAARVELANIYPKT